MNKCSNTIVKHIIHTEKPLNDSKALSHDNNISLYLFFNENQMK